MVAEQGVPFVPFIIDAVDLKKQYDGVHALRGLSVQVPPGSICGFLGRNGAGKTTTIKVLLGMTRATSGTARVFGLPVERAGDSVRIRQRTAFVGEDKDLYDYMTVEEIVRFTAAFYPSWRKDLEDRYLRSFELPLHRKVKALSKGMRTKLALLLALARGVELLILDEPTSGLDPAVAEEVLQAIVRHVADAETSVFFSSHQLAEVEQVADRVAIVDAGRTVVAGTLDDLRERFRRIQIVFDDDAPDHTFRAAGVERVHRSGRVLTVISSAGAEGVLDEARALGASSTDVSGVTLKDIFLETVRTEH